MGFFDKLKNTIVGSNNNTSNSNEKENKGVSYKIIETALLGVRQYYDSKVKIINKISKTDSEWSFYDKTYLENEINTIYKKINTQEREKENLKIELNDEILEKKKLLASLKSNTEKLELLKKQLYYTKEKENVEYLLKQQNNTIANLNFKIKLCDTEISDIELNINKISNSIIESYYLLVIKKSYIPNSYNECKKICEKYTLSNNFIKYGLTAINFYENECYKEAKKYAKVYFNFEKEENIIHNPIIDSLYVICLIDENDYEKAKKIIEFPLKYYPDSIELHKLLEKIHNSLGEFKEAELEKNIIFLLS